MDPIADMFATIRNNMAAGNEQAEVSYSKVKVAILELLKMKQTIAGFKIATDEGRKYIKISVNKSTKPCHLKRISKPGRRVFVKSKDIHSPLSGLGFVIVSTPRGLLTGSEARKFGLGGELICEVW